MKKRKKAREGVIALAMSLDDRFEIRGADNDYERGESGTLELPTWSKNGLHRSRNDYVIYPKRKPATGMRGSRGAQKGEETVGGREEGGGSSEK